MSTAQADFTGEKKNSFRFKSQRGKSCYLQGCKAAAAATAAAAAAAAGREDGARRWAIKHLVSSTEENMLIKPHVNTSGK